MSNDKSEVPSSLSWSLDKWDKKYKEGDYNWHEPDVNSWLRTHKSRFKEKGTILFPMCGKTVDMKYMSDEGYKVVGVEYSKQAVEEFFAENKIEFSKTKNADFDTYESEDGRITIHNGDFFRVTRELVGIIDGVWDRAALVAVNPEDRRRYADTITGLMDETTVYLVSSVSYDQSKLEGGQGLSVPAQMIRGLYGTKCDIELIYDVTNETFKRMYDVDWFLESLYCLKFKS